MSKNYNEFINSKKHSVNTFGFDPIYIPETAFDFQEHIIQEAVRKGRNG